VTDFKIIQSILVDGNRTTSTPEKLLILLKLSPKDAVFQAVVSVSEDGERHMSVGDVLFW
jgi:hypothetical protein